MNRLKSWIAAVSALFVFNVALASTSTTEITDMWWVPAESGWGVNVILQNDIAYLTFFVYDQNHIPIWYTSPAAFQGITNQVFKWTGPLYQTTGPWFGGVFDPAAVTVRQVGTATFTAAFIGQAVLTYTIDGTNVAKAIQRTTWRNENYTGTYTGGYSLRASNCSPSSLDGTQEVAGPIAINHSGTSFTATLSGNPSCTFNGTYTQFGKLGEVIGKYTCTDGTAGAFVLFDITPTISGFNGRMAGQNQACQWKGYFGGIVRAQ